MKLMLSLFTFLIMSSASAFEVDESKITSPQAALDALIAGNERFVSGDVINQDFAKQIAKTSTGQKPYATILSCLDSRIPPEIVFDQGIGDVFVGRVAGNIEDVHMLGSFEFATELSGTKLLVVMGHTSCGAVGGACANAKLGSLTHLLTDIQPESIWSKPKIQIKMSVRHLTWMRSLKKTLLRQCTISANEAPLLPRWRTPAS